MRALTFSEFSDAIVPAGVIDGVNPVFVLPTEPYPVASLQLIRNGQYQTAGIDYTLKGATVTFVNGAIPQSGDQLIAFYRH